VTCVVVENVEPESKSKLKPVMPIPPMGETAMLPVMADCGTVEMPVFERIV
jgi:hypothetical protein